ncbi:MAG: methyltransferase family protein, partial [Actinomycetota bacterium]
ALDSPAAATFIRKKTGVAPWTPATTLVTEGVYRVTRNPMYLGMTLLYLGLALGLGLMWALALLPVVVAIVDRFVIRREEAYLDRKFGAAYRDYRASVRRWI